VFKVECARLPGNFHSQSLQPAAFPRESRAFE
jgi:hypothetical protein